MKETVAGEHATAALAIGPDAVAGMAELDAALKGVSQIVWGEHCSECAYPACYAACSFYTPRPDLHCRRFEDGVAEVGADADGRAVRLIRFRRWGKLEGRGPAPVRPVAEARTREARDRRASRALANAPLPFAVQRNLAWRWNERKAAAPARTTLPPEAFVVEAWSADGRTHPLTLTILEQDGGGMFQTRLEAAPTYGRRVIPVAKIAARVDLARPFLVQIEPVGDAEGRAIAFGLTDFCALVGAVTEVGRPSPAPSPAVGPLAKVLVWDLDETLWSGTLAEDGPEGVRLRPDAADIVRELDSRGVLQSIASKNDHAEALAALARFGLADFFLHPQVNWGPKSDSLRRIANALDLGLDAFVFIDDQPFERGEVSAALPQVRTLPHTALADILDHAWFDHPATPEAGRRRAMYQAEAQRAAAFETGDEGDYLAFLRGCGVRAELWPLGAKDVTRVHELSQRTNQLNFTGAKFTRAEVEIMAAPDPAHERVVVRCEDRFGDYGVIGFLDLDLGRGELADFFMSCRVQRKRVEHALFAMMAERLASRGHGVFRVRFRRTERNGASTALLTDLGFEPAADGEWRRPTALPFADADVVRLSGALEPA